MKQDKIIKQVRKIREELSERFDNDLDKLYNFFKEEEKASKKKLKSFKPRKKNPSPAPGK